jgi:hypothetical protein
MKKRIILGLLVGGFLLFFITSTWAVDAKRAKLYGDPWQDCEKIPVTPQTIDNYTSTIKFIFILNIQNLPALIIIDKSSNQAQLKTEEPIKNSINSVKDER